MRSKHQILLDMGVMHRQYFLYLTDHAAFMKILTTLRGLEAELIEATGNQHDAYHLEHLSYMVLMDEFIARKRPNTSAPNPVSPSNAIPTPRLAPNVVASVTMPTNILAIRLSQKAGIADALEPLHHCPAYHV